MSEGLQPPKFRLLRPLENLVSAGALKGHGFSRAVSAAITLGL